MTSTLTRDAAAPCCVLAVRDAIDTAHAESIAVGYRALGDATRLRILSLIASSPDGEACVCDLTENVGLSQGAVSHHLKILVDADLLTRQRRGTWSFYRIRLDRFGALARLLQPATTPC